MRERIPKYITRFNAAISVFVWFPAWLKMWQTHSARDYALLSLLIILWLQGSNLLVAFLDRSKNLKFYLAVNTATVLFTCVLVWHYQH